MTLLSVLVPNLAAAPPAAEPAPNPTADPTADAVADVVDQVTDVDFWVTDVAPTGVRLVVILILAVVLRTMLVQAVDRVVARRVQKQLEAADSQTLGSSIVIEAERGAQRANTLGSLFHNIISIVVYTVAGLLLLAQLGFNLGPLIAGAGILGVALGFGAQSLVADFLAGIFILMEDQYSVGDIVDVGDAAGTVEEVQLRLTKIRSVDGVLWFVRNGEILRVGNQSQDWSRTVLDIGIAYGSNVGRAKEIMEQIGQDFDTDPEFGDKVLETPEVWGVESLSADSVVIRMVVKTKPGQQWAAARELRERIKAAFDANGIDIPFPQRTVWLRTDEGAGQSGAGQGGAGQGGAGDPAARAAQQ
ncbi:MAG: mechanosensitive ion channel family protein [Candidatus Nanopelagicales bacterium]